MLSFHSTRFFGGIRTGLFNGYLCFVCSIAMIGICTAVIGDVAAQLGCFICLKDSVNAIAFVALGTSVPGSHYNHSKFIYLPTCKWNKYFIGLWNRLNLLCTQSEKDTLSFDTSTFWCSILKHKHLFLVFLNRILCKSGLILFWRSVVNRTPIKIFNFPFF